MSNSCVLCLLTTTILLSDLPKCPLDVTLRAR
jgi:hypothetical protein